jgi:hypothetical protein
MSNRRLALLGVFVGTVAFWLAPLSGQSQADLKTAWGAPDLQGIWEDQTVTPFERARTFGTREFLTPEEIAERQKEREKQVAEDKGRDRRDASAERDVAGAYNAIWSGVPVTAVGRRTSQVIDPPDGRIPARTPEAEQRVKAYREYQLALLQATDTCKRKLTACRDGQYVPTPSPRRFEMPPVYNVDRINRADGPEDNPNAVRCLTPFAGFLKPQIGTLQRIVQSPDAVAFYYDIGQGGGFSHVVPITNVPHLPKSVEVPHGDARARWEGDTLVVDITNFTQKTDFRGSRQNLHLVERYRRVDPKTLEYKVTVDDPTTWTKPWTAIVELTKQDEKPNQIYQQTCHEGNYGQTGILANFRAAEKAFAEGTRGDPALEDNASGGGGQD